MCPYCKSPTHTKPKPECEAVFNRDFTKLIDTLAAQQFARERSYALRPSHPYCKNKEEQS